MSHHDEATLVAFNDGELPPAEVESIRRHVERCAECRARLDEVRRLEAEALDLIGAIELLEPADAASAPAMVAAEMPMYRMAMPAAASVSPPTPTLAATGATKRPRRWVTGLAWAATIVLAVGLGYSAASLRREPASVVAFRDAASPARANATAQPAAPAAPADSAPATASAGRRPAAPEPRLQSRSVRPQPATALADARAKITAESKKAEALRDERQVDRKDEADKEKDALAKAAPPAEQQSRVRAENPPPNPPRAAG